MIQIRAVYAELYVSPNIGEKFMSAAKFLDIGYHLFVNHIPKAAPIRLHLVTHSAR